MISCKSLVGKRFGRLICLSISKRYGHNTLIRCLCDCGKIVNKLDCNIKSGKNKSCGCWGKGKGSNNANWKGYKEISGEYLASVKASAKTRNIEFDITKEVLWDIFIKQNRRCALSGQLLFFSKCHKQSHDQTASLDRINSKIGYIQSNLQWIHKDLNFMKQAFDEKYFIDTCKRVAFNPENHEKYIDLNKSSSSRDFFLNINGMWDD